MTRIVLTLFSGIPVTDVINNPPLVSLSTPQSSFKLEALINDNFIGSKMSLTAHGAIDGASVSLIHIVPCCPRVVKTMDHISLVNVRKVFLLKYLNVKVLSPLELSFKVSLSSLSHMNIGNSVTGG